MKKVFFAIAAVIALSATSCGDCVDCGSATGYSGEICKDDYTEVGGISWETYKDLLVAAGCEEK